MRYLETWSNNVETHDVMQLLVMVVSLLLGLHGVKRRRTQAKSGHIS